MTANSVVSGVDVVGVLDDWCKCFKGSTKLARTRDAIAELVAAVTYVDALSIQTDAHKRLRAALAACKPKEVRS